MLDHDGGGGAEQTLAQGVDHNILAAINLATAHYPAWPWNERLNYAGAGGPNLNRYFNFQLDPRLFKVCESQAAT